MYARVIAILFVFLSAASLLSAQQTGGPAHETPPQHPSQASVSREDAKATREDIQRMKSLVQQMQTNLAFVTTIQGPLKHQFELEIEMWQLQIARLERRIAPEDSNGVKR